MNIFSNLVRHAYYFPIIALLLLAFAWQFNNLFHVSGNTDGFQRLYGLIPLGAWLGWKATTLGE